VLNERKLPEIVGSPVEQVAQITGLTAIEIEELQQ
jgi:hypothetical protein